MSIVIFKTRNHEQNIMHIEGTASQGLTRKQIAEPIIYVSRDLTPCIPTAISRVLNC